MKVAQHFSAGEPGHNGESPRNGRRIHANGKFQSSVLRTLV